MTHRTWGHLNVHLLYFDRPKPLGGQQSRNVLKNSRE